MALQKNTVMESFLRGHAEETARQQREIENNRLAQQRIDELNQHQDALKQLDIQNKRQAELDKINLQTTELNRAHTYQAAKDAAVANFLKTGVMPTGAVKVPQENPVDPNNPFGYMLDQPSSTDTYNLPENVFGPKAQVQVPNRANYFQGEEDLQRIQLENEIKREQDRVALQARVAGENQRALEAQRAASHWSETQAKLENAANLLDTRLAGEAATKAELQARAFSHDFSKLDNIQNYDWSKMEEIQGYENARNNARIMAQQKRLANNSDALLTPQQLVALAPLFPKITPNTTIGEWRAMGNPAIKLTDKQTEDLAKIDQTEERLREFNKTIEGLDPQGRSKLEKFYSGGTDFLGTLKTATDFYPLADEDNAKISAIANKLTSAFKNFEQFGGALTANEERYLKGQAISDDRYQSPAQVKAKLEQMGKVLAGARLSIQMRAGGRVLPEFAGFQMSGADLSGATGFSGASNHVDTINKPVPDYFSPEEVAKRQKK